MRIAELVLWSLGSEAKKDADKIGETAKYLRKQVKDIVRTAVLFGYNLNDALATQTQEEMEVTIRNLLQGDAFLNGDIEVSLTFFSLSEASNAHGLYHQVGGQTILGVPFGNRVVRHFMQHILFYQLNLQQYVGPSRNLGALFAFIGTLFEWALRELSTGVFIPSDFDLSRARVAFDNKLSSLYRSMSSDVRSALVADIYAQRG